MSPNTLTLHLLHPNRWGRVMTKQLPVPFHFELEILRDDAVSSHFVIISKLEHEHGNVALSCALVDICRVIVDKNGGALITLANNTAVEDHEAMHG